MIIFCNIIENVELGARATPCRDRGPRFRRHERGAVERAAPSQSLSPACMAREKGLSSSALILLFWRTLTICHPRRPPPYYSRPPSRGPRSPPRHLRIFASSASAPTTFSHHDRQADDCPTTSPPPWPTRCGGVTFPRRVSVAHYSTAVAALIAAAAERRD